MQKGPKYSLLYLKRSTIWKFKSLVHNFLLRTRKKVQACNVCAQIGSKFILFSRKKSPKFPVYMLKGPTFLEIFAHYLLSNHDAMQKGPIDYLAVSEKVQIFN